MKIEYGYCHCGCGQKTEMSDRNRPERGVFKGKPNKFIYGHDVRGGQNHPAWKGGAFKCGEYIRKYSKGHPRACRNHVLNHILVAEKILGKPLPIGVVIHHYGNKEDDSKIVLCQDQKYHNLIHARWRALISCGNASFRKCRFCKTYDDMKSLYPIAKNDSYHPACRNRDYKERHSAVE